MFWAPIFIGVRDGHFGLTDAIVLGAIWIALALIVCLGNKSPWYFIVPSALLSVYTGWVVWVQERT